MRGYISCDFGPGEKFLYCEECGREALHWHGLEIDGRNVCEVSENDLDDDAKCDCCLIKKNEG
tara:strand:+ start:716 stop:904 length:189 start_codon:yes stop_codon:yes gene_type:complete